MGACAILLALSRARGSHSKCVDFALGFLPAFLDDEVHVEIPQIFDSFYDGDSYVLKLKYSTYGLKQSNFNFFNMLDTVLKARNIFLCFTDKCACASKNLTLVVRDNSTLVLSKKKIGFACSLN